MVQSMDRPVDPSRPIMLQNVGHAKQQLQQQQSATSAPGRLMHASSSNSVLSLHIH